VNISYIDAVIEDLQIGTEFEYMKRTAIETTLELLRSSLGE
jgi:hypothetical protein